MSRIRSRRTKPEMRLHGHLKGIHWGHRMWPNIQGRPDILVGKRTLVFVHGCFWHGCPQHFRAPKTNTAFWTKKIERNRERHEEVTRALRRGGFRVVVVWEHELNQRSITAVVDRVRDRIKRTKKGV